MSCHLINSPSPWIKQPNMLVLAGGNQLAAIPVPWCTESNFRKLNLCYHFCGSDIPDKYLVIRACNKCTETVNFLFIHSQHKLYNKSKNGNISSILHPLHVPSVLWCCWFGGRKGIQPVKTEWWGAGVVICLRQGADLHMAQLMSLPLTVSCFSIIQIGSGTGHPTNPGQSPEGHKMVCVGARTCVCVCVHVGAHIPCISSVCHCLYVSFTDNVHIISWIPLDGGANIQLVCPSPCIALARIVAHYARMGYMGHQNTATPCVTWQLFTSVDAPEFTA